MFLFCECKYLITIWILIIKIFFPSFVSSEFLSVFSLAFDIRDFPQLFGGPSSLYIKPLIIKWIWRNDQNTTLCNSPKPNIHQYRNG